MDWNLFLSEIKDLSDKIINEFKPDILIALARGGWIPTRLLSAHLKVKDIASLGIKYIDDEIGIYSEPSLQNNVKNILLVEDILESGKALNMLMIIM